MNPMDFTPSAILAQLDFMGGANIPPLPGAPLIERFFLTNPWPMMVIMAIAAIAVFVVLNARGKIKVALISAAVLLAAAAAIVLVATLIQTDREHMQARTRELVKAVAEVDRPALESLFSDDLTIRVFRVPPDADKDQIIAAVETQIGRLYKVNDYAVLEVQATLDGPRVARTQTRVRVGSDMGAIPSWWRLDWVLENDAVWRVRRIEALWIPGVPNPGG